MTTPILVATDGRPGSIGAVRIAHLLAERTQRPLLVLTVLETVPLEGVDPGYPLLAPFPLIEAERADALRASVVRQLRGVAGPNARYEVDVEVGSPAPTIVRRAMDAGADLVVVGQRRHSMAERWLGADTSLRTVQLAHVPVLVVPPGVQRLPDSAVVGVDFSGFSLDAARTALCILGDEPKLHLVHVGWSMPMHGERDEDAQWVRTYNTGAIARLEELRSRLHQFRPFQGTARLATGDPATEILHGADQLGAAMIAVGSHGYGFLGRVISGSVSSALLRRADRPLLVAPPRSASGEMMGAVEEASMPARQPAA